MKTTLEKWLLFFGVLLFCWLVVPELDASAAEVRTYEVPYGDFSFTVTHTIDDSGLVHTFSTPGAEDFTITLNSSYPYIVCAYTFDSEIFSFLAFRTGSALKVQFENKKWIFGPFYDTHYAIYCDKSDFTDLRLYVESYNLDEHYLATGNDRSGAKIYYSNYDIYDEYGSLVFQRPLPTPTPTPTPVPTLSLQQQFQTAVMETDLEAVMNQVVGLSPLLIGLLITLISFSKGLRLLSQILHRA